VWLPRFLTIDVRVAIGRLLRHIVQIVKFSLVKVSCLYIVPSLPSAEVVEAHSCEQGFATLIAVRTLEYGARASATPEESAPQAGNNDNNDEHNLTGAVVSFPLLPWSSWDDLQRW
jgi:hypothetical protein